MFIGRIEELNEIKEFIEGNDKSLLLYGKRRVGKTELLKQGIKNNYVYFECIKDTLKNNVSSFLKSLQEAKILDISIEANTFIDVFSLLKVVNSNACIIIDEYPYLYAYSDSLLIDSHFQKIIDELLVNNKLIICGSNVKVMTSLLQRDNALYGRFGKTMFLDELTYLEAQEFYKDKSIYDKIAFYSVFGGSPYLNLEIDPNLSLEENIKRTFLKENSNTYQYCYNLYFTDVPSSLNINSICDVLKNGKKTCSQIESFLNIDKNGGMNKKLDLLVRMNLISKYQPINKLNNPKATKYEIDDNAMRFFYSFVYKNKSILKTIGSDRFYKEYVSSSIVTFISHRFEEQVRKYISYSIKKGKFDDVINVGTYYYDDSLNKTNGEFDVALKIKGDKYRIIEVKYYKDNILTLKEMIEENEQIKRIKEIGIDSVAFLSASGYEANEEFECLDVADLYEE